MRRSLLLLLLSVFMTGMLTAQSKDEKAVAEALQTNASSFEKKDKTALEKVWANDDALIVFENGEANYGWLDHRDNHLRREMREMKNINFRCFDVKIKLSGKTSWATFKYAISGEMNGRAFDSMGLGTAILEKRDGRWLIVHWHTSAPRRPAAATPAKPSL